MEYLQRGLYSPEPGWPKKRKLHIPQNQKDKRVHLEHKQKDRKHVDSKSIKSRPNLIKKKEQESHEYNPQLMFYLRLVLYLAVLLSMVMYFLIIAEKSNASSTMIIIIIGNICVLLAYYCFFFVSLV